MPALGITQMPGWFFGLALAGAVVTLCIGLLRDEPSVTRPALNTAGAYMAAASAAVANPGVTAAGTIAWLLGCGLLSLPDADEPMRTSLMAQRIRLTARAIGGLCLIGLPLTVGFVGQSGIAARWGAQGLGGVVLILGFVVTLALLTLTLLRMILDDEVASASSQAQLAWLQPGILRIGSGWLVAALTVVMFGLAPNLLDAGDLGAVFARNGIVGWLVWLVALGAGFGLWRYQRQWLFIATAARDRGAAVLNLDWFYSLLGGAGSRLSGPFARVFDFLESDGALLWAMIAGLLLLLIARPGGP
jgi:hypothetical protein